MKEEDLTKAIELKKKLDRERELLQFANSIYVDLRVNLEERCDHGHIRNVNSILGDSVVEELRKKIIALVEERINELQKELEKL